MSNAVIPQTYILIKVQINLQAYQILQNMTNFSLVYHRAMQSTKILYHIYQQFNCLMVVLL